MWLGLRGASCARGRHSPAYTEPRITLHVILTKQVSGCQLQDIILYHIKSPFNWLVNLNLAKTHSGQTKTSC